MWALNNLKNRQDFSYLIRDAKDYALISGIVFRYDSNPNDDYVARIPLTLLPSPFPKRLYQECLDIQPIINKMMLKIANESDFLENSIRDIISVDDFTNKLFQIHTTVLKEGISQPVISCINRSDYMLNVPYENDCKLLQIRQVEVNAISSGMSTHCCELQNMHSFLLSKYDLKPDNGIIFPPNDSSKIVVEGMIEAFDSYNKQPSYILMVLEDRSINFSEHLSLELEIRTRRPDVKVMRRRFTDLPELIKLGPNKELLVEGREIALVYFRYGYDPSNYCFDKAWDTRLIMERSRAIKCPSINFHLSGIKKFQEILNSKEQLERFLDTKEAERLSRVFCKFWPLDGTPEGQAGFQMGLKSNKNLVLKPQREGGGHNIFGQDIESFLSNLSSLEERAQYSLMELINCPKEMNVQISRDEENSQVQLSSPDLLVNEIGIYGSILASGNYFISNKSGGYLLRNKKLGINEGGVASGHAGVGSLMLFDDIQEDMSKYYSL